MTLSEFHAAWFAVECLVGATPRHAAQYRESIALWASLTGDPSLANIDRAVLAAFCDGLTARVRRDGRPISPVTIAKHCRYVQAVLDRAGPVRYQRRRGQESPCEAGLYHGRPAPYLRRPKTSVAAPDGGWSLDEIGRWIAAASRYDRPQLPAVAARVFWPALVRLTYNTGLRMRTLLGLRREHIRRDGWLAVPGSLMKSGRPHRLWLNAAARDAIAAMATADAHLVPWPWRDATGRETDAGRRNRGTHTKKILDAAGIDHVRRDEVQSGKPYHGLRAAMLTQIWTRADPLVASAVAGHAARRVTEAHYIRADDAIRAALENLEQPPEPAPESADSQRTLFD